MTGQEIVRRLATTIALIDEVLITEAGLRACEQARDDARADLEVRSLRRPPQW